MRFVVAQLGARNKYTVPTTFERAGILEKLYTDLLVSDLGFKHAQRVPFLNKLKPIRQVAGKTAGGTPPSKIQTFPLFGLTYWARLRLFGSQLNALETFLWAGRQFCTRVAKSGFANADSVYTFNSAALEILEAAKAQGLYRVLEQTIAPKQLEREILEPEREAFGNWEVPLPPPAVQADYEDRERAEAGLADLIVSPSGFVERSMQKIGWPVGKCVVVPYGADALPTQPARTFDKRSGEKLKLIFVGTIDLRKGAHYTASAAAALQSIAEFSMLGVMNLSEFGIKELQKSVNYLGVVPRNEVQEHMARADVFVLPSLCEGSATVCYEAFAAGLPVITTENAGSVVRHGIDGFIVPIRDTQAIVDCVTKLAADRELLRWMSNNARNRSAEFTTEAHGRNLVSALTAGVAA
jgi:glycosyltransferase involved in cell wall biosynthesis